MKERLKQYIENIEQLSADARYYNNANDYDRLRIELESIKTWCNTAIVLLNRLEKGGK